VAHAESDESVAVSVAGHHGAGQDSWPARDRCVSDSRAVEGDPLLSQRHVVLAQVMLPADANPSGDVHGGTLMKLADTAGGIAAVRHTRRRVVTAIADSMTFEHPVKVGDLVLVDAEV